ncbi:MAG: hypothetical protein AAGA12_09060 [Pseudomonadota bacterium]
MQAVRQGYKGLKLLVVLNLDRFLWPVAIAAGLGVGSYALPF